MWHRIFGYTVDGCEVLHHRADGWNPTNNGINHRSTGDSDFFHPQYHCLHSHDIPIQFLIKCPLYSHDICLNYGDSPLWLSTSRHTSMMSPLCLLSPMIPHIFMYFPWHIADIPHHKEYIIVIYSNMSYEWPTIADIPDEYCHCAHLNPMKITSIIYFNRIFPYKPNILGYPHVWKPPNSYWLLLWMRQDTLSPWTASLLPSTRTRRYPKLGTAEWL